MINILGVLILSFSSAVQLSELLFARIRGGHAHTKTIVYILYMGDARSLTAD